jgi:hypothetical protein
LRPVLVLSTLALTALLIWQWQEWPPPDNPVDAQDDPAATVVPGPSPPEENPLDLLTPVGEKDEYAVVTERPLFLPDRRPPSEEQPPEEDALEPEQDGDLARMDLNAVVMTPKGTVAWVRDPGKKGLHKLSSGDELAGWSVREIHADRILLERQGETSTLILRDYKNMPPPAPRRKTAARSAPQRPAQGQTRRRPVSGAPDGGRQSSAPQAQRQNPRRPAQSRPDTAPRPGLGAPGARTNPRNTGQLRQGAGGG